MKSLVISFNVRFQVRHGFVRTLVQKIRSNVRDVPVDDLSPCPHNLALVSKSGVSGKKTGDIKESAGTFRRSNFKNGLMSASQHPHFFHRASICKRTKKRGGS